MAKMDLTIAVILPLACVLVLCGGGHSWPNFSCHSYNSFGRPQNYSKLGWGGCLKAYEKFQGNCAQICLLSEENIHRLKEAGGPVIFDVGEFVNYFAATLGYNVGTMSESVRGLMRTVGGKMEKCKETNPEYKEFTNLTNTPCEPWKNFLQCFDNALGCQRRA